MAIFQIATRLQYSILKLNLIKKGQTTFIQLIAYSFNK